MIKNIYFINAKKLAEELNKNNISDSVSLNHFAIFIAIFSFSYQIPIKFEFSDGTNNGSFFATIFVWLLSVIINYFGVWLVYQKNAKGDNKDFFKRFCSLSLPVSVRLGISFLVVGAVLALIFMGLSGSMGEYAITSFIYTYALIGIIYECVFYLTMRKYIDICAKHA